MGIDVRVAAKPLVLFQHCRKIHVLVRVGAEIALRGRK